VSVFLVGAGPGDADLLTIRAARILGDADVVVRDRLVDDSVMEYVNPNARVIDVGKSRGESSNQVRVNELLVELAHDYEVVVRLKGGDPFVFGRGGEEVEALRDAGVTCSVVPGLSSAFAGPLAAGIPVTYRGLSRGVSVVSARGARGEVTDFRALANGALTLVILMGIECRGVVANQLIEGGLHTTTPVAVVEQAWTRQQRTTKGLLSELGLLDVRAPAIIVVGEVASLDLSRHVDASVALL